MSHRWIKFWPQDWQRDPALRSCGIAARGIWIDMLCIMHEGSPYGHLTINGKMVTPKQIGAITGVGEREANRLLAELEDAGVFSRSDEGTIFSRRMVRDHEQSEEGKRNIAKRWGSNDAARPPTINPIRHSITDPTRGADTLEARSKKEKKEDLRSSKESRDDVTPKPEGHNGTRLPDDWNPGQEGAAFARDVGLDPAATFARFRDYWKAKPGAAGRKLDWLATWRNWCRKEGSDRGMLPLTNAQGDIVSFMPGAL